MVSTRTQLEPALPHSPDIERSALGAILLDVPGTNEALAALSPSHFFLQQHATIYRRLKEQVDRGDRPDLVTLNDALTTHGELEKIVGGSGYVSSLIDGIPQACPLDRWVELLLNKASLRQAASIGQQIQQLALSANGNAADALQEIAFLSAHIGQRFEQKGKSISFESASEAGEQTESVEWLVKGYVAEGGITVLSAKVKMGKTTLVTHLVKSILGNKPFLGARTKRTPVVYLTEQPKVSFKPALQRANLTNEPDLRILYFNQTIGIPWVTVAAAAAEECTRVSAKLLIVDTLSQFAGLVGDSENNSGAVLEAVQPLQAITGQGAGVLILSHDRKSGGEVGDATRGSSALPGAADVVLSLRRPEGNGRKSLRVIQSLSRFSETPEELVIDLTNEGYVALGEKADVAMQEALEAILHAVPTSEADALTLKDLCAAANITRPTGQRALEEMCLGGKIQKLGNGKRGDPFRYFLTEKVSAQTPYIYEQKELREPGED